MRLKIILSNILEIKFRFETGTLFFMSSLDNDGFFIKGVVCDIFRASGKEPDFRLQDLY